MSYEAAVADDTAAVVAAAQTDVVRVDVVLVLFQSVCPGHAVAAAAAVNVAADVAAAVVHAAGAAKGPRK